MKLVGEIFTTYTKWPSFNALARSHALSKAPLYTIIISIYQVEAGTICLQCKTRLYEQYYIVVPSHLCKINVSVLLCFYIASMPLRNMSSVNFNFSPHVITTRILVQVAMEMNHFEFVAQHLGFEENRIIRLQEDYDTHDERCYQMLREWWENSPNQSATLEELHEALCSTDQGNCLPKKLEECNNYENINWLSYTTGISAEALSNTYTLQKDTAVLATKLIEKYKWHPVGRLVGLDDAEIDEIQHDYKMVRERAYQMLRRWREKQGSSATLSQLAVALLIVRQPKAITCLKNL